MLEKSFGLVFFLKKPKSQRVSTLRPVYLRITINGIFKDVSIKRDWKTEHWNTPLGRASGNSESAKELNSYLEVITSKVYQAKKQLIDEDKELTAENVKNVLTGRAEERHMILEAFKYHNEQMKALIGTDFAPSTLTRYKTAHDHTESFIKWKYGVNDLPVKELNYEFASQFAFWLKSERKCGHNAAVKYISNLKKDRIGVYEKGLADQRPFCRLQVEPERSHPRGLNQRRAASHHQKGFQE